MPRKTLALIIGLIIVTVVLFIIALRTGDQTKNQVIQPRPTVQPTPTPFAFTNLMLSPNPVEVAPGRQGVVDVMIDTQSNNVTAVQLELIYDPLMVSNVRITPDVFFPNPVVLINKNDVNTGRITYALGIQPNQKTINGIGSVAKITFTARGAAGIQSSLTLLPTTLATAQGITESVLKTSSGTVINIVAATEVIQKVTTTPATPSAQ